jgi:hypothetical protein
MTDPNSFYIAPRKGQAKPPSTVDAAQVREWSAETEIDPGTGAVRSGGTFAVTVASSNDQRWASVERDKLRDSGFPAAITQVGVNYEIRIEALPDSTEANALVTRLRRLGYSQAAPSR